MTRSARVIDIHVGSRIRMRRSMLGMSQSTLADSLGISFQQVQKYEKGINRVGAGRLQRISELLTVPVSFFFERDPSALPQKSPGETSAETQLHLKESMILAKAFLAIEDNSIRQRVLDLMQSLGGRKRARSDLSVEALPAQLEDV